MDYAVNNESKTLSLSKAFTNYKGGKGVGGILSGYGVGRFKLYPN